jgi:hypothetical protein
MMNVELERIWGSIKFTIPAFAKRNWQRNWKLKLGYPESGHMFEPRIFRIRSRIATH